MSFKSPEFGPDRDNLIPHENVYDDARLILTAERDALLPAIRDDLENLFEIETNGQRHYSYHDTYLPGAEGQTVNRLVLIQRKCVDARNTLYSVIVNDRSAVSGGGHRSIQEFVMSPTCGDLQYRKSEVCLPIGATEWPDFEGRGPILAKRGDGLLVLSYARGGGVSISMVSVKQSNEELFNVCAAAYRLQDIIKPLDTTSHEPDVRMAQ